MMDSTHTTPRPIVPPGTGRLGIVRVYFDTYAALGAGFTVLLILTAVKPALFAGFTVPAHLWLSATATSLFTWGAFETSRRLRDRKRSGGWAAGFTLAASLVPTASHSLSLFALGLSLAGLGLLASVWRHLE